FLFSSLLYPSHLPSFPTRRSSDLNRQLLSAFFIVVILFGVFFTMGYVVGRNSAPASAASLPSTTVASSQRPEAASPAAPQSAAPDRKSTRLNSSHGSISYAVFCLK